jgi:hypothetical protein
MHYPVDREQAEHPVAQPAAAPTLPSTPAEALRPPVVVTPVVQEPVVAQAVVEE